MRFVGEQLSLYVPKVAMRLEIRLHFCEARAADAAPGDRVAPGPHGRAPFGSWVVCVASCTRARLHLPRAALNNCYLGMGLKFSIDLHPFIAPNWRDMEEEQHFVCAFHRFPMDRVLWTLTVPYPCLTLKSVHCTAVYSCKGILRLDYRRLPSRTRCRARSRELCLRTFVLALASLRCPAFSCPAFSCPALSCPAHRAIARVQLRQHLLPPLLPLPLRLPLLPRRCPRPYRRHKVIGARVRRRLAR